MARTPLSASVGDSGGVAWAGGTWIANATVDFPLLPWAPCLECDN